MSTPSLLRAAAVSASLLFAGCPGDGGIFLTVEASGPEGMLQAPEDADALDLKVLNASGPALWQKRYPLGAEQTFPLTLGLEPGGETEYRVVVEATLLKAEQPVAAASALVPMNAGEVTSVTLRLSKQ